MGTVPYTCTIVHSMSVFVIWGQHVGIVLLGPVIHSYLVTVLERKKARVSPLLGGACLPAQ